MDMYWVHCCIFLPPRRQKKINYYNISHWFNYFPCQFFFYCSNHGALYHFSPGSTDTGALHKTKEQSESKAREQWKIQTHFPNILRNTRPAKWGKERRWKSFLPRAGHNGFIGEAVLCALGKRLEEDTTELGILQQV